MDGKRSFSSSLTRNLKSDKTRESLSLELSWTRLFQAHTWNEARFNWRNWSSPWGCLVGSTSGKRLSIEGDRPARHQPFSQEPFSHGHSHQHAQMHTAQRQPSNSSVSSPFAPSGSRAMTRHRFVRTATIPDLASHVAIMIKRQGQMGLELSPSG
jgi:hypothetical protein